jgi:hypothetical protein
MGKNWLVMGSVLHPRIILILFLFFLLVNNKPGMYAVEVIGQLPDDVLEYCEEFGLEYKANRENK